MFAQPWEVVDRASLEARVREVTKHVPNPNPNPNPNPIPNPTPNPSPNPSQVAMHAMWDSVQAQVGAGEFSL